MIQPTFPRFDDAAAEVLRTAWSLAAGVDGGGGRGSSGGGGVVSTETVLLALVGRDRAVAELLARAGADLETLRHVLTSRIAYRSLGHEELLSTLGVDLQEIRRRTHETFGSDVVARAAIRGSRDRRRRRGSSWRRRISCRTPQPFRRRCSPLADDEPVPIPRVKRLLDRAARRARPRLATPHDLLQALLDGDEPAAEVLAGLGVDLEVLRAATRNG